MRARLRWLAFMYGDKDGAPTKVGFKEAGLTRLFTPRRQLVPGGCAQEVVDALKLTKPGARDKYPLFYERHRRLHRPPL